jgi:hypothetical protein
MDRRRARHRLLRDVRTPTAHQTGASVDPADVSALVSLLAKTRFLHCIGVGATLLLVDKELLVELRV